MKNAEWMIKNGHKFSDLCYCFISDDGVVNFYLNGEIVGRVPSLSYFEALKKWLDMEHKEQILNDAEKKYLSAVIKPFRDKVDSICKENFMGYGCEHIVIGLIGAGPDMALPLFKSGAMYKGMELGHEYMLEELGL